MTRKSNHWGIKALMIAASFAGTLGGWAVLAADQVVSSPTLQPATARGEAAQPAQPAQPTQVAPQQQTAPTNPQSVQPPSSSRQTPNNFQPRARTRSSR
ncbi:MAG: hypothetical protein HY868_05950 [Chloroflexi bacterium]|nr:hypothetical protein [Chloroflexota bacterium]